jgi:hypothetical protein
VERAYAMDCSADGGLAAYVMLSRGVSTELQQWNPNAPMPAIGSLSGKERRGATEGAPSAHMPSEGSADALARPPRTLWLMQTGSRGARIGTLINPAESAVAQMTFSKPWSDLTDRVSPERRGLVRSR